MGLRRSVNSFGTWAMILGAALAFGCGEERPSETTVATRDLPDEVFSEFITQESDSGLMQWRLNAPRANRYVKRKLVLLEKPVIDFFDDLGEIHTTLVSDSGEYSEDTGDMLAFGNVVVRSVDGDVLETDSLLWNNKLDKIQSDSFVRLTRGSDVVTGYGLECDPSFTSVDIKRNVQATIVDEEGGIVE